MSTGVIITIIFIITWFVVNVFVYRLGSWNKHDHKNGYPGTVGLIVTLLFMFIFYKIWTWIS